MADNLQKKPAKGILKNSSSFDKQETHRKTKETKWDEMNIIATLHPPDKDYGHMKIEEPKTPYSYEEVDPDDSSTVITATATRDCVDANALAERLRTDERPARVLEEQSAPDDEDDEEEEEELTPQEKALRKEFEMKRKAHYNEYYAVKLARKLLEEEEEEEEDEQDDDDDADHDHDHDDKDKKKEQNASTSIQK